MKLRNKCIYTVIMLAVAVLMTQIPVYGVNRDYLTNLFSGNSLFGFLDLASGGSLSTMSFAAFGISSYITASIIIQLMSIVVPALERIQKEGETGRYKIERATFLLSLAITLIGAVILSMSLGKSGLFINYTPRYIFPAVACWLIGSVVLIVLAKQNDKVGIGNGISLVLLFNILSRIPSSLKTLYAEAVQGHSHKYIWITAIIAAFFIAYLITVYLQCGMLHIPLKPTRKTGADYSPDGFLPMGVNIANVMPVIFASSLISMPALIGTICGLDWDSKLGKILKIFQQDYWWKKDSLYCMAGFAVYILLLVGMAYFYSNIAFNAAELADRMKKNGDIIPCVKPGAETEAYLEQRRKVMTGLCILFLLVLSIVPDLICTLLGYSTISFAGTSLIIIVNVLFDTVHRFKAETDYMGKKNAVWYPPKDKTVTGY